MDGLVGPFRVKVFAEPEPLNKIEPVLVVAVPSVRALAPVAVSDVKLGVLDKLMALQVPPEPSVIVLPLPDKLALPEADGHIKVVFPCTAVLAPEP